jgi:hypothetical protein
LVESQDNEIDRVVSENYESVAIERTERGGRVSNLNQEPAQSIKETASGIEIVAVRSSDLAEKTNNGDKATVVHQSRQRPVIEKARQPIQIETVKTQSIISKPEIRKIAEVAAKPPSKILEFKPKAQSPVRPVVRPVESKAVKNTVPAKSNRTVEVSPKLQKIITKVDVREPISIQQQVRIAPIASIRQVFSPARIRASGTPINQRASKVIPIKLDARPITSRFSQRAVLPFRTNEFNNRNVNFKPTTVVGDEEVANNNAEVYIPEFELAA